jgi:hypothetical protein
MPQPPIAPTDVRPLLRTHWEGIPRAMAVLMAPPVLAALRSEVRWGPHAERLRRADPDPDEHLHAGIVATLDHASRRGGLAVPAAFWSRSDARPFVAQVFRHRLVDRYRRESRFRVGHDADLAGECEALPTTASGHCLRGGFGSTGEGSTTAPSESDTRWPSGPPTTSRWWRNWWTGWRPGRGRTPRFSARRARPPSYFRAGWTGCRRRR